MSQESIIGSIRSKLCNSFPDGLIEITDNSPEHASHLSDTKAFTTHVKVRIISDRFKGVSILDRHKQVYEILKSEILHLHAITIDAKTPDQKAV
jgi:stress-induced morphogen